MNRKIMIVLSSLILIVAVFGLFLTQSAPAPKEQAESKPIEQTYSFLVAARDLKQGEVLDGADIAIETLTDIQGKEWGDVVVDGPKDLITDSILLSNISKGQKLSYSQLARPGSEAYDKMRADPKEGLFPFGFALEEREYQILSKLKPNEYVDIYFKYETKNKKSVNILAKKDKKQPYASEDTGNSSNLFLVFANKRVLFLQKSPTPPQDTKSNDISPPQGVLNIELDSEEIKKIYAIENLGYFYIFPTSVSARSMIGTNNILTKEFIKEFRGGENAQIN
ncbi:hypothetical protein BKH46_05830 [Helicobacter sp. 12S02634-8]|uniref:SAF domain-containing protein n=1 Tax=Helicobacter sp. 12S02634-8 TaxID=1476199 RepID=UPI000BA5C887|nr:SAF domain-containing protein [Helicobacter sp. 12S02634-8]PAF46955.1 hypothetical protein BKH46_05830 [Helicobacter sp. 12S02634-8]